MRKKLLFLLAFLVGAIIVISLVAHQKNNNKSDKHKQSFERSFASEKWYYGDGDAPYGNIIATQRLREERIKRKTDSMIRCINLSTVKISRDSHLADRFLSGKELPLPHIYTYFRDANLFKTVMRIDLSQMGGKLKKYLGFKENCQSTWESSMKKMIKKFSPALSKTEKKAVAKSLLVHAELIERLVQLSDVDQANLVKLLDTIVMRQDRDFFWLYSPTAQHIFIEEHNILKKVWKLPKIIKGNKVFNGNIYCLGKYVENPWSDENIVLVWNTRWLSKYQYAVGVWHRRCRDVYANTPQQRRDVALKISSLLKEAAAML